MADSPAQSSTARLAELVDRIEKAIPDADAKMRAYLAALRDEIKATTKTAEDQQAILAQYEEAYEKLTQPANRIGLLISHLDDGLVQVMQGDQEFVATIDPKIDAEDLKPGDRVKLNEAYAIVGHAPASVTGQVVPVGGVLDDGRLRIATDPQGMQGRIIPRSRALESVNIKTGDEVILDATGKVAVEHIPKVGADNYFIEEIPITPWSAVGGQEEAIDQIKETIERPLLHPELYKQYDKRPPKGILLYGPPGCGKTLLGKAIAYNLAKDYRERTGNEDAKECFMHISGPKILNMWLGETERMIREIFSTARAYANEGRIVVIFIDEAESVLRTRSSGRWLNISNTVVPQFCAEMDGMEELRNVVIVLTSNRPDYIDPAVLRPERIDRKIRIRRPDQDAARQILGIYLHENIPIDQKLLTEHDGPACARKALIESTVSDLFRKDRDTEFLEVLSRSGNHETLYRKDLLSGALLKSIVDRAKDFAIARSIAEPKSEHGITMDDMREATIAEFKENEIFPKTEAVEDWLKLLDIEPESVVEIRAIRTDRPRPTHRSVI